MTRERDMTLDEIVGKYLQLTSEAGAQACCQIMTDEAGEGEGDELYDDGGEGAAISGRKGSSSAAVGSSRMMICAPENSTRESSTSCCRPTGREPMVVVGAPVHIAGLNSASTKGDCASQPSSPGPDISLRTRYGDRLLQVATGTRPYWNSANYLLLNTGLTVKA